MSNQGRGGDYIPQQEIRVPERLIYGHRRLVDSLIVEKDPDKAFNDVRAFALEHGFASFKIIMNALNHNNSACKAIVVDPETLPIPQCMGIWVPGDAVQGHRVFRIVERGYPHDGYRDGFWVDHGTGLLVTRAELDNIPIVDLTLPEEIIPNTCSRHTQSTQTGPFQPSLF